MHNIPRELLSVIASRDPGTYYKLAQTSPEMRSRVRSLTCDLPIDGKEYTEYLRNHPEIETNILFPEGFIVDLKYDSSPDPDNNGLIMRVRPTDALKFINFLLRSKGDIHLFDRYNIYRTRRSCINQDPNYARKKLARDFERSFNEAFKENYTLKQLEGVLGELNLDFGRIIEGDDYEIDPAIINTYTLVSNAPDNAAIWQVLIDLNRAEAQRLVQLVSS